MRHNPAHATTDPEAVRDLIRENPWATIVSSNGGELVASHYPVLLDEGSAGLALLTHVGRPDEQVHSFGATEVLVIVQGRHGCVSPSWYGPEATLTRLVERFERAVEQPRYLDQEWGREIAKGTVGLRIRVAHFVCKRKLSQDKDDLSRRQVIAELREPGPYMDPGLADEMEREWEAGLA